MVSDSARVAPPAVAHSAESTLGECLAHTHLALLLQRPARLRPRLAALGTTPSAPPYSAPTPSSPASQAALAAAGDKVPEGLGVELPPGAAAVAAGGRAALATVLERSRK